MEDIIDISGLSFTTCQQQEHFVDHTFVLEKENHFRYCPKLNTNEIQYRRITEVLGSYVGDNNKGLTLFGEELTPHDIVQGILPDCFLITACSILATRPALLQKLFITKNFSSKGLYCLQFYQQGEWKLVIVDDYIPCSSSKSTHQLFATCRNKNEIWPQILEKAYAKLYGSYDSLNGGNVSEAIVDLTGCPVEDFNLERPDVSAAVKDGSMWSNLKEWIQKKYLVACTNSTRDDLGQTENKYGIINNHAYGILDIIENGEKFLLIRNPHGHNDIDNMSERFTKSYKWLSNTKDGCSWIKFSDFAKYFNRFYCCKIIDESSCHFDKKLPGSWLKGSTAGGCTFFASFRRNPMFKVSSDGTTNIFLTLQQQCLTPNNYKILHKTSFWNKREVSTEINLSGDVFNSGTVLVVPSTYYPDQEATFSLHARSLGKKRLTIEALPLRCMSKKLRESG